MEKEIDRKEKFYALYKDGKETAERILRVCDRVLSGESETTACLNEGIKTSHLRRFLRTEFTQEQTDKGKVTIPDTEWVTWKDRFLRSLLGTADFYAPEGFETYYDICLKIACTERERIVLDLFYKEEMSLLDIGKRICLCREQVREIVSKAMRKLRYPGYRNLLLYGPEYEEVLKEFHDAQSEYDKEILAKRKAFEIERSQKIQDTKQKTEALKSETAQIKSNTNPFDIQEDYYSKVKLEELGLSVRAYNALHRRRIVDSTGRRKFAGSVDTLFDLMKLTHEDLCCTVNMGKGTIKEVETLLKEKYGITLG